MPRLLLHRLGGTKDLCATLRTSLQAYGLHVDDQRRAWRPNELKTADAGVTYVDGYVFYIVPLYGDERGLTVLPRTFFFVGNRNIPTILPASALGPKSIQVAQRARPDRIKACAALLKACSKDPAICAPETEKADSEHEFVIPSRSTSPISSSTLRPVIRKRWLIVSHVLTEAEVIKFARSLGDALKRSEIPEIKLIPLHPAPSTDGMRALMDGCSIVLVGIKGARGEPLDDASRGLLNLLDELRVPYRLFADASLTNRYAALDQLGHLCALGGSQAIAVNLGAGAQGIVFVGMDLGHPLAESAPSRAVITCVGSDGRLLAYWTGMQRHDETLQPETLEAGLRWMYQNVFRTNQSIRAIVALRDGRIPHNERSVAVLDSFELPTFPVECIKRPTPFIATEDDAAPAGTFLRLGDAHSGVAFLQPPAGPVKGHMVHSLKLHFPAPRDGLTLDQLGAWVYALCHAPALGLRPTSAPSPIYWADGIASLSATDHQFAGMHHVIHN